MILTLITVGKMLEARSKGKTTDALKGLMKLAPKTAVVVRDGQEATVPIEQVRKVMFLWYVPVRTFRWMEWSLRETVLSMRRHLQGKVFLLTRIREMQSLLQP